MIIRSRARIGTGFQNMFTLLISDVSWLGHAEVIIYHDAAYPPHRLSFFDARALQIWSRFP